MRTREPRSSCGGACGAALAGMLTQRTLQDLLPPERTKAACEEQATLAQSRPDGADLQYLALRYQPESPARDQEPCWTRTRRPPTTLGSAGPLAPLLADRAQWKQAYETMEQAIARMSPPLGTAATTPWDDWHGSPGSQSDLEQPWPPNLRTSSTYLELELGDPSCWPLCRPSRRCAAVSSRRAVQTAADAQEVEDHVLRLAGTSRGASEALEVKRALELPMERGLGLVDRVVGLGLRLRHGQDPSALMEGLDKAAGPYAETMREFISNVRRERGSEGRAGEAGAAARQVDLLAAGPGHGDRGRGAGLQGARQLDQNNVNEFLFAPEAPLSGRRHQPTANGL